MSTNKDKMQFWWPIWQGGEFDRGRNDCTLRKAELPPGRYGTHYDTTMVDEEGKKTVKNKKCIISKNYKTTSTQVYKKLQRLKIDKFDR